MIPVLIESPYAGQIEANERYMRACLRDSLLRGEAPFASHALYTQLGVLDDGIPEERELGIEAGLVWGRFAHRSAIYVDRGISSGMQRGIRRAQSEMRTVELRRLPEWLHGEPPLQPHELPRNPPKPLAAMANVVAIELALARSRHARLRDVWDQVTADERFALFGGIFR